MSSSKTSYDWDINDSNLPKFNNFNNFEEWVDGHSKLVYSLDNEQAKKHSSGWAMRNTNNHNVQILKKSCLGVLICTKKCNLDNNELIHIRPAICDKARKKQQGKPCPNSKCNGKLEVMQCTGNGGYPVTHFWRHHIDFILFQSKGNHNHPRPEPKSNSDMKRMATMKALKNSSLQNSNYIRKYNKNKLKGQVQTNLYHNENKQMNTKICQNNIVINKYNSFNYINAILPQTNVTSYVNTNSNSILNGNHSSIFGNSVSSSGNNTTNQLIFNQKNLVNSSSVQQENFGQIDLTRSLTESSNNSFHVNSSSNNLSMHQTQEKLNETASIYPQFVSSSLDQNLNCFLSSNLPNTVNNPNTLKTNCRLRNLAETSLNQNLNIQENSNCNKINNSNDLQQQYLNNQKILQPNKLASCLSTSNYLNFSSSLSSSSSSNSSLDCVRYYHHHHRQYHYSRSHFSLQQNQSQFQNQQQFSNQQHQEQNQQSLSFYQQQSQQNLQQSQQSLSQSIPQQTQPQHHSCVLNNQYSNQNIQYIDKESIDHSMYIQQAYLMGQQQQQHCKLQVNVHELDLNSNNYNETDYSNANNETCLYDHVDQHDNSNAASYKNDVQIFSDYCNKYENSLSNIDSNYYWNSQNHGVSLESNNDTKYSYSTQSAEDSGYSADSSVSSISNYTTPKQSSEQFRSNYYLTLNEKKKLETNHEMMYTNEISIKNNRSNNSCNNQELLNSELNLTNDFKLNYLNYLEEDYLDKNQIQQSNNLFTKDLEKNSLQINTYEPMELIYTPDLIENSFVKKEKKTSKMFHLLNYDQINSNTLYYQQNLNLTNQNQNYETTSSVNSCKFNNNSTITFNSNTNNLNNNYINQSNLTNQNNFNDFNDYSNFNNHYNLTNANQNNEIINTNNFNNISNLNYENCDYSNYEQSNMYQTLNTMQTPNEHPDDYVVTYLK